MKNKQHTQQVRIIGGTHRRRIVKFDEAEGLRPTPDRVREQVFNWLGQRLNEQKVLDLFGGSGSTLIGAEKTGRNAYLMELDPKYCDVIINRWQTLTGKDAILESTGDKFNDL